MKRTLFLLAFVLFPLLLIGCNNQVQLSGQVTYSDDGTPLETGRVIFDSDKFYARGDIGESGRYVLATHKANDGLPPGQYRVYVADAMRSVTNPDGNSGYEVPLIAPKHTSAETSELVVEVNRPTKTFDFQVDRAPGSKK